MDDPEAIVSPGGIGYDINCGVRLIRTNLHVDQLDPVKEDLMDVLKEFVPVGAHGRTDYFSDHREPGKYTVLDIKHILEKGMDWAIEQKENMGIEMAWPEDKDFCEDGGVISDAAWQPGAHQKAISKGGHQLGTLGSGNHYLELQAVNEIYDHHAASKMGITQLGQVCIMIHCGSRGLGHQFACDCVQEMVRANQSLGIPVNDSMLSCVPINSELGRKYLSGMAAAANFAFVNRSVITMQVRRAFEKIFCCDSRELDMHLVYDVAHNIAKEEYHVLLSCL